MYYLGVGRYVLIVHKREKFSEELFFKQLRERVESTFDLNNVNVHLNLFVAVINLESGKINKKNFYKYFRQTLPIYSAFRFLNRLV